MLATHFEWSLQLENAYLRRDWMKIAAGVALLPGAATMAWAQPVKRLRIGLAAPNTTIDPHLQSNAPNNALATHIFDSLVVNDEASRSKPGLASSWKIIDETHWEFKMRPGIKFSDGTPFGPEDVKVSINRAGTIPSVASFRTYTRSIKSITASGNNLIFETTAPDPLLPNSLSRIRIISAKHKDTPSAEFNAGRAAIGTGPYVLKEYVPGSHVLLARNESYWGEKSPWPEVQLRIVTDAGARVANLLSGELDLIDEVPYEALERIKADKRFHLITGISSRVVYLAMDQSRDVTPFAFDQNGKPLPKNPFKNPRVRQAIDLAISRRAIIDRVMEGNAVLAAQFLPKGAFGTSPKVEPALYDPNKARALLAEAGFPNGFKLTIHGPNNRYVNDAKIVQAVAQMLTRVGIAATVEVMPWSVYAGKSANAEFSFCLGSWGVNTGETSNPLVGLVTTFNKEGGTGASNLGRYSNPQLDAKVMEATRTIDNTKRALLLAEASEIVFADRAILPLHYEKGMWAARKELGYVPRADQYTLATSIKQN